MLKRLQIGMQSQELEFFVGATTYKHPDWSVQILEAANIFTLLQTNT